jgi:hypothetical protein
MLARCQPSFSANTFGTRMPFIRRRIHFRKRRVFRPLEKRARLNVYPETDFDYDMQLPGSDRTRGRFWFWLFASIAVCGGLVAGAFYPMHAFGPSNPNSLPIKLKTKRYVEALQASPSLPQKGDAELGRVSTVEKPAEGLAQPLTRMVDAIVPLPRPRPNLQIVRYSKYYYVRTVDQGDTDGRLNFHIERRLCKSPNLPPVCFEPLSVRQQTILNDF